MICRSLSARSDVISLILMGPNDETVLILKDHTWQFPCGTRQFYKKRGLWESKIDTAVRVACVRLGLRLDARHVDYLDSLPSLTGAHRQRLHFCAGKVKSWDRLVPVTPYGERVVRYPLSKLVRDMDPVLLEGKPLRRESREFLEWFMSEEPLVA